MKNKYELNQNAAELRERYGEDDRSPIDVFAVINSLPDVTLVYYPMSDHISGMCIRVNERDKLIAINSTQSYGRQRFTAAHELYHLNYQENFQNIICTKELVAEKDVEERNADAFASYFLAPMMSFKDFTAKLMNQGTKLVIEDIIKIEQYYQMSRQATLFRLFQEGLINQQDYDNLKTDVSRTAARLGYDDRLYRPSPESKKFFTSGAYIKMVESLNSDEVISMGKYKELLLEAYRHDIVFNTDLEDLIND